MSDFLHILLQRSTAPVAASVQPRMRSRFEPGSAAPPFEHGQTAAQETTAARTVARSSPAPPTRPTPLSFAEQSSAVGREQKTADEPQVVLPAPAVRPQAAPGHEEHPHERHPPRAPETAAHPRPDRTVTPADSDAATVRRSSRTRRGEAPDSKGLEAPSEDASTPASQHPLRIDPPHKSDAPRPRVFPETWEPTIVENPSATLPNRAPLAPEAVLPPAADPASKRPQDIPEKLPAREDQPALAAPSVIRPRPKEPEAPAPPLRAPEADATAGPIIRVTIGRVEVRATAPAAPAASRPAPPPRRPALSLDNYLQQRNGGRR